MAGAKLCGLSGNELYCMAQKNLSAGNIVLGNSIRSMGFIGSLGAAFRGTIGGEVPQVTAAIHEGREAALTRMIEEARREGLQGVAGVTSEVRHLSGNTEFLIVGSGLHGQGSDCFTSAGDAQELYCHMDAGYAPIQFVFGNIAYAVGAIRGIMGSLKLLRRGEIQEFSDIFNTTRHLALSRLVAQAAAVGAQAVVGVRTTVMRWGSVHEMFMSGTAVRSSLSGLGHAGQPATSDLTGQELWAMAHLGYAPVKLLMSTSVYSLGMVGGLKAAFQGLTKGEVPELTTLIYEARENVFARMRQEADAAGATQVVGIKTFVLEIGSGLIEVVAIGTAIRKLTGAAVASSALPVQAIVRDQDTWVDGDGGFMLESAQG